MLADHPQEIIGERLQLRRADAGYARKASMILGHHTRHFLKRPVVKDHECWLFSGLSQPSPQFPQTLEQLWVEVEGTIAMAAREVRLLLRVLGVGINANRVEKKRRRTLPASIR